ncbi:sulfite exporter TauE/SafE family protein [Deinococcus hopiensis]|uniref:sulfite exporter TauE/SafE family protein n=1 Tax=Deinococcus hopiensis TaxID=309885 RepID=UPI002481B64E|nr:sulfite exporter TauE/SafE family protein [Deinococcus hopiensis]
MLVVTLRPQRPRDVVNVPPRRRQLVAGYALTPFLAVYGGFFSGGYVTLLTAAFLTAFRMPFPRAVATTKVINVASSLVATLIFARKGAVDWQLGLVLSGVMHVGVTLRAKWTMRLDERWVHRLFATTVLLAFKTLALGVPWSRLLNGQVL